MPRSWVNVGSAGSLIGRNWYEPAAAAIPDWLKGMTVARLSAATRPRQWRRVNTGLSFSLFLLPRPRDGSLLDVSGRAPRQHGPVSGPRSRRATDNRPTAP